MIRNGRAGNRSLTHPRARSFLAALAMMILAGPAMAHHTPNFPAMLTAVSFSDLPGWQQDDHGHALEAFARSCTRMATTPHSTKPSGVEGAALAQICGQMGEAATADPRAFFEAHFTAYRVEASGLLTGYFEPQVNASFTPTDIYRYPLYALPDGLQQLPASADSYGIRDRVSWGMASDDGGFEAFHDRAAIMAGALDGMGLEIAYLANPLDAFFIHIQGSARLAMRDGTVQRVNFAGKTGHDYTPIGRTLVQRGDMALEDVTMDSLRAWLEDATPEQRDIVLATNRSYIFFTMTQDAMPDAGPTAAAGVPLTAGRSLAVDRHLHTFGTPVFVTSPQALPNDEQPLSRLMIAQDTGSAIVGPARGDIFIGSGDAAGAIAGDVNQPIHFTILVPKDL